MLFFRNFQFRRRDPSISFCFDRIRNSRTVQYGPYSETLKSHQHLTQLKNALLLIYESHLTSESNLERLISKILSQPVPYPSSGIPTNILILPSLDYVIKWGASTWWSSSLCCSMPKLDEMTIGKAHPTLFIFIPT